MRPPRAAPPTGGTPHVEHRIRPPGNARLSARGSVREAGQRIGHGGLPGAVRRGRARFRGFLGAPRAREAPVVEALHEDARRVRRPLLQVVPRRRAERVLQLPRPAPEDAARQGRDHLRGGRRNRHQGDLQGPLSPRLPVRQRAEGARHPEGRARPHLHADVHRGRRGDAGLRAHRRHPLGRLRRLLRQEPARTHHRRRRGGGDLRRRPVPRRQGDPAQARGGRGARHGRVRGDPRRLRLQALRVAR